MRKTGLNDRIDGEGSREEVERTQGIQKGIERGGCLVEGRLPGGPEFDVRGIERTKFGGW